MKKIKKHVATLVAITCLCWAFAPCAQTATSSTAVESGISAELAQVIQLLSSPDTEERVRGLSELRKMGKQAVPAVPVLINMLRDKDRDVTSSAAIALGDIKDSRAVEPLVNILNDSGDSQTRSYAANALGLIRDNRAYDALARSLKDRDYSVRSNAAGALGDLGDARATEALIELLKDNNESVRLYATFALGKIADRKAVPALIEVLRHDPYLDVRRKTPWCLGQTKDQQAIEVLVEALGDQDAVVRDGASDALAAIGTPSVPALIQSTKSKNSYVRLFAARALGEIGSKDAILPLVTLLKDPEFRVRKHAVEALGKIADPHPTPEIIAALSDQEPFVRRYAAEALGKLHDAKAVEPLISVALHDVDYNVSHAAAQALTIYNLPTVREELVRALSDKNQTTRINAATALGFINYTEADDALIGVMNNVKEDPSVRICAAYALYQIGDAQAIKQLSSFLTKTLKSNEPRLTYGALRILEDKQYKLDRIPAVEPLIALLRRKDQKRLSPEYIIPTLKSITGKDFGPDADQWLAWWKTRGTISDIRSMGKLDDASKRGMP